MFQLEKSRVLRCVSMPPLDGRMYRENGFTSVRGRGPFRKKQADPFGAAPDRSAVSCVSAALRDDSWHRDARGASSNGQPYGDGAAHGPTSRLAVEAISRTTAREYFSADRTAERGSRSAPPARAATPGLDARINKRSRHQREEFATVSR